MLTALLWSLLALLFYAAMMLVIVLGDLSGRRSRFLFPLLVFGFGIILPYHPLPLQISSWVACAFLLFMGLSFFGDDGYRELENSCQGASILLLAAFLAAVRLAAPDHGFFSLITGGAARLWGLSSAQALLAGLALAFLFTFPIWSTGVGEATSRWFDQRREKAQEDRRDRLTAQAAALPEDEVQDLRELWRRSFVSVQARGRTIEAIDLHVSSEIRRDLQVRIVPGTCFVSAGAHQNMAARTEVMFRLPALCPESVEVPATCINAVRPIPQQKDRFERIEMVQGNLVRFLTAAAGRHAMVVQAGAWAISDGYTAAQLQARLQRTGPDGWREPAISRAHIAEAKTILLDLGIATGL